MLREEHIGCHEGGDLHRDSDLGRPVPNARNEQQGNLMGDAMLSSTQS